MVTGYLARIVHINHIEGVQAVLTADCGTARAVFQNKNHALFRVRLFRGYGMQSKGDFVQIGFMRVGGVLVRVFQIIQQIKTEFVQAQIHYGYAVCHVFYVHHFFLQAFQLAFAVFQIVAVMSTIFIFVSTFALRLIYSSSVMSGQKFTSCMQAF